MDIQQVLKKIEEESIEFVRFEQGDTYGVARTKIVPSEHFEEKATGGLLFYLGHLGFDPQANIADNSGCNEELGYPDALTFPALDTFTVLPYCENTARVIVEPTFKDTGKAVEACPRTVARRQVDRLKELGYSMLVAHEHEFFVVDPKTKEPYTKGWNYLSTLRTYKDTALIHQYMRDLKKMGISVEVCESEYGPGQLEIDYKPSFGIKSADTAHAFRGAVKEIAQQRGYIATFMTKPWPEFNGSSCHFNHSLWDIEGKRGLMFDESRPNKLSELAEHWLAGLLAHAPAMTLLLAPTINCLKRFKPYTFAPVNVTWGIDNRTTQLRVKVGGEKGTYVENRMGAAGGNPYIALAANIAAGIDGIQRKLTLPPEVKGDAYNPKSLPPRTPNIPTDMKEALACFANDEIIRDALGEDFCKCFSALKVHELKLETEAKAKGDGNWEQDMFMEYL